MLGLQSDQEFSGKLAIKAELDDDIRRILIHNEELTYDELILMMQRVFRPRLDEAENLVIKYKDEDGEYVTIAEEFDLSYAIHNHKLLRLKITIPGVRPLDKSVTLDETVGANQLGHAAILEEVRRLREEFSHLSEKIDNLNIKSGPLPQPQAGPGGELSSTGNERSLEPTKQGPSLLPSSANTSLEKSAPAPLPFKSESNEVVAPPSMVNSFQPAAQPPAPLSTQPPPPPAVSSAFRPSLPQQPMMGPAVPPPPQLFPGAPTSTQQPVLQPPTQQPPISNPSLPPSTMSSQPAVLPTNNLPSTDLSQQNTTPVPLFRGAPMVPPPPMGQPGQVPPPPFTQHQPMIRPPTATPTPPPFVPPPPSSGAPPMMMMAPSGPGAVPPPPMPMAGQRFPAPPSSASGLGGVPPPPMAPNFGQPPISHFHQGGPPPMPFAPSGPGGVPPPPLQLGGPPSAGVPTPPPPMFGGFQPPRPQYPQ